MLDQGRIIIGQPLPFSVYSADRKLLLAKGQIVESERVRQLLLRAGRYQSDGTALVLAAGSTAASQSVGRSAQSEVAAVEDRPLDLYMREYMVASADARVGIRLSRDESGESFPCWILGADANNGLIVSAPESGRSFVTVTEGQTWIFRTMYLTAAVKFTAIVRKVQFEPLPALNISTPKQIELRHVRSSPRVAACVRGVLSIDSGKELPMLVTDISATGLRIALERKMCEPKPGQRVTVSFAINMLGRDYSFKVPAIVINRRSELEQRNPELCFVGLKIESQTDLEKLVLHSYVYERMMLEFNPLWRVLVQAGS